MKSTSPFKAVGFFFLKLTPQPAPSHPSVEALGEDLTQWEVGEMIRQVDKDRDGKVNFAEFFDLATR